jgi:hypothetical protein
MTLDYGQEAGPGLPTPFLRPSVLLSARRVCSTPESETALPLMHPHQS